MKTLVIVAHPRLSSSTTQAFFKAATKEAPTVTWHELIQPFNISVEQQLLQAADRIIFQFPMYWYSGPAILKAWLDEVWNSVLTSNQLVKGKQLGIVVTVAHSPAAFNPGASQQYTVAELLRPYQALAHATKMTYLPPLIVYQFAQQTEEERQLLYIQYQQYLTLPEFQHFSARTRWFIAHLKTAETRENDPIKRAKLTQLINLITDQRDELDDLQASLGWLREKEDN